MMVTLHTLLPNSFSKTPPFLLPSHSAACLPSAACGLPGLTQKPRFSLLLDTLLLQAAAEIFSFLALFFF